jgi:hypothetical protein
MKLLNFYLLLVFTLHLLFFNNLASANDSSYFGSGNQIIPLQETNISVKKEVLTIKRINDIKGNKVRITVDYIFHNPSKEKSLLMGFEASTPYGDAISSPRHGEHPYIDNFSVSFNGKTVPHKVSFLTPTYKDEGKTTMLYTIEDLKKNLLTLTSTKVNGDIYVYHFPASFPSGDTQVIHTYDYAISGSVFTTAEIEYLLTPALRWANHQIDDFTLIVDLGEFQQYHIFPTFFNDISQWTTQGRVKVAMEDVKSEISEETMRMMTVWQHHGSVTFHAKNFRPKGELSLFANRYITSYKILDVDVMKISLQDLPWISEMKLKDEFTRNVLENLPYARRGFVFQNQKLKTFFEAQPWYIPDPECKDASITDEEKAWLKELSQLPVANDK